MPRRKRHHSDIRLSTLFSDPPPRSRRRRRRSYGRASAPSPGALVALIFLGGLFFLANLALAFIAAIANILLTTYATLSPLARLGYVTVIAFTLLSFVGCLITSIWYLYRRRQQEKRLEEYRRRRVQAAWRKAMEALKLPMDPATPKIATSVRELNLDWRMFEELATNTFKMLGYQVTRSGRTGDQGIDVFMTNPDGAVEIVQCKYWQSPIGDPEVARSVGAMLPVNAKHLYVWSINGFTRQAQTLWGQRSMVTLCDAAKIDQMIETAYRLKPSDAGAPLTSKPMPGNWLKGN